MCCLKRCVVFLDAPCPKDLALSLSFSPSSIILLLAEHPEYQATTFSYVCQIASLIISPYVDTKCGPIGGNLFRTLTSFVYKQIPTICGKAHDSVNQRYEPHTIHSPSRVADCVEGRHYIASIVCSNLTKPLPAQYAFRRHLINCCSQALGDKFIFYGRGWNPASANSSNLSSLKKQLKAIAKKTLTKPKVLLDRYMGELPDKSPLLNCSTTYSVENFLEPPGFVTEKLFEPLIYGCLPIYVGNQQHNPFSEIVESCPPDAMNLVSKAIRISSDRLSTFGQAETMRAAFNQLFKTRNDLTSLSYLRETLKIL